MRYGKIGAGCLAAALCLGAMPAPAWAGTPEFAYTAEQWASLRDNQLDFTEIADLIHVYNNTVIQNQLEYEDFRGKDADDIADDYYDAAMIYTEAWNILIRRIQIMPAACPPI